MMGQLKVMWVEEEEQEVGGGHFKHRFGDPSKSGSKPPSLTEHSW